jgi:hypothetical protein
MPNQLYLERSGGFAGVTMSASFDPTALSSEQRAAVEACLGSWPRPVESTAPDRFVYRFELGSRQAFVPEDALPGSLRPLLRRLSPRFNQAGS